MSKKDKAPATPLTGNEMFLYYDKVFYDPKKTTQRQKLKSLELELQTILTQQPNYHLDGINGPEYGKHGEWIYTFKLKKNVSKK